MDPEFPEVSYVGRGAAAGPMLMGAMGPMGIAVGIAIDEGIGKDIKSALSGSLVQNQATVVESIAANYPDATRFALRKVEFKVDSNNDDLAYATTTLTLYPSSTTKCFKSESSPLDELKASDIGWKIINNSFAKEVACKAL
ncbi:hypothetical protein JL49_06170 [Pseudoalteromonas luteoviolacea]|uniref:Uncharacterized protein n=2 Tax=Pseudoalteromonas luteoviolacea TaxID=43657 RepID=A0A162A4M9_9GAMM|nr:hypothetical protein N482_17700 [Pseudoalteromonas luteoviolacea NCIMB 1942]KZX01300.1 hypothetical protein JL49_06170 [Pseudoalteromonas luteoviolacea]